MKCLFIINPSSGRQNFMQKIKTIIGELVFEQICNTVDVYFTEKQDDALNRASVLQEGEYDFVVAVGGDGTLNEVINGVMISESKTPVAVISAGTVNDFATYLKLPQEPAKFCDMIRDYCCKWVDVGRVNDKYFINVVAAGTMSDIGFKVGKDKKATLGKLAYYVEGAIDLPKQFNNVLTMRFTLDDTVFEDNVLLFIVTNTQSVGGFHEIAPLASTSDGVLDVIIIEKMDFLQVAPLMVSLLSGDHVNHSCVKYYQTTKLKVENISDITVAVDYDGEKLENDWPLDIEIIPAGIQIIVPKKN